MKTFLSAGLRGIPLGQSDSNPFWTSLTDGPPAEPVPGAVTSLDTKPAGVSDTDWARLIAEGLTAGGTGYAAAQKAAAAAAAQQAQKAANARTTAALFPALTTPTGGLSPNALFLIGGIVVLGVVAAVALSR